MKLPQAAWRRTLGVAGWLGLVAMAGAVTLPVVPAPRDVQAVEGNFAPPTDGPVTWRGPGGETRADFSGPLQAALARWRGEHGAKAASKGEEAAVALGLPGKDEAFRARCERLGLQVDDRLGREGYLLHIGPAGITAAANEEAGLFYALQTLSQILRATPRGAPLAGVRVRDWPEFAFRGLMDDISRGPLSNAEFLRAQIRRCAEMKLNRLNWYIEDVVRVPSHPGFAPAGAIPLEEFRALADYAAAHHVELVGGFQTLGHFDKILRVPAYAPLGATPDMLEPAVPETLKFLSEVVGDMLPVFSAGEFSLNGDEAFDLAEAAERRGLSAAALYAAHFTPLIAQVERSGKTPVIWGDMMLEHRELLDLLPKGVVVGTWNYDADADFDGMIAPFRAQGFDAIVCPGVLNSYRISPDIGEAMGNIAGFVAAGRRHGALGVLTTVWDDGGMHLFARDWPGVGFAAEQSWNPDAGAGYFARYDAVRGRRSAGATEKFLKIWGEIGQFGPTWLMNNEWRFARVVPAAGEELAVNVKDWARIGKVATCAEAALGGWGDDPDAAAWRWTAAEVRWHADWRAALARWNAARGGRVDLAELDALIARQEELRDELKRLWSVENREHFTVEALAPDTQRLEDLRAWKARLASDAAHAGRVRVVDGSFLTYWMVTDAMQPGDDLLASMGGEERAKPKPGMRFEDPRGRMLSWSKTTSQVDTVMDLPEATDGETVRYAYAALDADAEREATLRVRGPGEVKVWVNGAEVAAPADGGAWALKLSPGRNGVLLKLMAPAKGEAWWFSAEMPGEDLRHRKYRYDFYDAGGE